MTLIICADDRGGMAFNRRRQSQDRIVREHILADAAGGQLWMSPYSARQFGPEQAEHISADEDFLEKAGEADTCFLELSDPTAALARAEKLIVYRWNRTYPFDLAAALPPEGWTLAGMEEFSGHSHEKITKEVYTR